MITVVASGYPDLESAVAAVELAGGGTVWVDADTSISASCIVPPTVALRIDHMARLVAAGSSVTLTINGPLLVADAKIFEGFGAENVEFDRGYANATPRSVIPEWWGVNDGTNQDQVAINNALHAGSCVLLSGQYNVSAPILFRCTSGGAKKTLRGRNGHRASILAAANDIKVIHLADSFNQIRDLFLSSNGRTGVTLLSLTPEAGIFNTTVVHQNQNLIDNIVFDNADEGVEFMAGVAIGDAASGCWYNRLTNLRFGSVRRAIWFRDSGSTDIWSSGPNSNYVQADIIGSINTGVQVDGGGGNHCKINGENITYGTIPNAVPTGIVVKDSMANGGDNPNNLFETHFENVTRHAHIDEPLTRFINSDLDHALVTGAARNTMFDDGKRRDFNPTITADAGGISFAPEYSKLSFVQCGSLMAVTGYLQVSAISGSPTGVIHIHGLPRSPKAGTAHRATCAVALNNLSSGGDSTTVVGRILEGTATLDIFGWGNNNLQYLAPYFQAGTNITISLTYLTN